MQNYLEYIGFGASEQEILRRNLLESVGNLDREVNVRDENQLEPFKNPGSDV